MICPRCKARMIWQKFYAIGDSFYGWRCVVCGEVIDPVILENRANSKHPGGPKEGKMPEINVIKGE